MFFLHQAPPNPSTRRHKHPLFLLWIQISVAGLVGGDVPEQGNGTYTSGNHTGGGWGVSSIQFGLTFQEDPEFSVSASPPKAHQG